MPRVIHLNGPSRVGKSTLARRYADDHPGTLVLDPDVLAGLVGGWRDDFAGALETARDLARALAARHLGAGHDVLFPQLVTSFDRVPDATLEETAAAAGATYVEVALLVDEPEHLQRLRDKRPTGAVEARVQEALTAPGSDLVGRIRGHLAEHLATRPHALRINTTGLTEDAAYHRLRATLDETRSRP